MGDQIASGAEHRSVYLDAISAAMRNPGRAGTNRPRNLAEDVVLRKLRQADKLRKQLDRKFRRAVKADPEWSPSEEDAKAAAMIGQDLDRQVARLGTLRKQTKEAMAGLTDEQLDAVFLDQFKRVAYAFDEHTRHVVISILMGRNVADVDREMRRAEAGQ